MNWTVVGPSDRLRVCVRGAIVTLETCLVVTVTPVVAISKALCALTDVVPNETPLSKPAAVMLAMLD